MKRYLNYGQYVAYGHTTVPESRFTSAELKARKRIDLMTASRIQSMEAVPEAVQICMAMLIDMDEKIGIEAQLDNPVVTSYSVDGYSESYGNAMGPEAAGVNMNKLIIECLYGETDDNGVPLLYRGVRG